MKSYDSKDETAISSTAASPSRRLEKKKKKEKRGRTGVSSTHIKNQCWLPWGS